MEANPSTRYWYETKFANNTLEIRRDFIRGWSPTVGHLKFFINYFFKIILITFNFLKKFIQYIFQVRCPSPFVLRISSERKSCANTKRTRHGNVYMSQRILEGSISSQKTEKVHILPSIFNAVKVISASSLVNASPFHFFWCRDGTRQAFGKENFSSQENVEIVTKTANL